MILFVALLISFIVQQITLKDDDYIKENSEYYHITLVLNIALIGLDLVLQIILLVILSGLKQKWKKTREKSELKSGKFFF